jgi:hypothetical protein
LTCLNFGKLDLLIDLKRCVAAGGPVLFDNVGTRLETAFDPLLAHKFLRTTGETQIVLAGRIVPIESRFRLFVTTKYPNPPFSPEVCALIALVNFATTTDGLTDLPWNALFEVEREDLDRKRVQLMESSPEYCRRLHEIEGDILTVISNAGRDALEDTATIDSLQTAQRTSAAIEAAMTTSEKTDQQIQLFKERFRSVAECGALLDRCVPDFRPVNSMDQFSWHWFVPFFRPAVRTADLSPDHQRAVPALNRQVVHEFHVSVSFPLVTRHKHLFSTFLAVRTLTAERPVARAQLATHRGCPRTRGSARQPSPTRHRRLHRSSTTSA